mmetsp:Transcript_17781/g.30478  ORF Transcript_17781/g.30478 Transcript_17781/m.30478 type:complete len:202 (-) Transcript_17781:639-1244(-)
MPANLTRGARGESRLGPVRAAPPPPAPMCGGRAMTSADVMGSLLGEASVRSTWRLRKSHTCAVPSSEPETRSSPSSDKLTLLTARVCAARRACGRNAVKPPFSRPPVPAPKSGSTPGMATSAYVLPWLALLLPASPTNPTSYTAPSAEPAYMACSPASKTTQVAAAGRLATASSAPSLSLCNLRVRSNEELTTRLAASEPP